MTFGVSHHLDSNGSDTWNENGLVSRMSRIAKDAVPEMIVMSDTCFCEYTSTATAAWCTTTKSTTTRP